jgi:hypothetical protein
MKCVVLLYTYWVQVGKTYASETNLLALDYAGQSKKLPFYWASYLV